MNALRQAVDKPPVDTSQVQNLLRRVQGIDPPPNLESQSPFVIGSALAVIAESIPDSADAEEQWATARKLLEGVGGKGLSDADKSRLEFRLAKTWAHTGEPIPTVIGALVKSINCGDDVSEGHRLLAELYLKVEPPESKKARDSLKEYLAAVIPGHSDQNQRQLNQARLRLGEICLQLGEIDDARKALEKIGPDAPAELLGAARALLGKSYADDDWDKSIRYLEQARDVRGMPAAQRAAVLYQLADVYLRSNHRELAVASLDQLRKSGGAEGLAAALKMAQLQLRDPKLKDDVAQNLENSLHGIQGLEDFSNKLMTLAEARAIFEEAALQFREMKAFELSVRVARAYSRIAEKARDRVLAAEALQAWGQHLIDQIPKAGPGEGPALEAEGTKRLREAAKEWHEVASLKKNASEKGDPLWRAAELYVKVDEKEKALSMLDELGLRVPDFLPERLIDVWLKKGEIYLSQDNREQARICFVNGIQIGQTHPSPSVLKCRIRLAEVLLHGGDPKVLGRALDDLKSAISQPGTDKELHESAMLMVANAYFQRKDYRQAEDTFAAS